MDTQRSARARLTDARARADRAFERLATRRAGVRRAGRRRAARRTAAPAAAIATSLRGHDVVDHARRLIGTITDVVHDEDGAARWAVVDLGLLQSSHYVPLTAGTVNDTGELVVPFDKNRVKTAPQARRDHLVDVGLVRELERHYRAG